MKRTKHTAHVERMKALKAEASKIVATGKCPECGTGLVRNLALTGWWQCGAYGEPGFRKAEYKDLPHCGFQTFTD
jgi:ssDNA-binding Zn-finger/Zn-ribbon topoisomerase 1